MNKEQYKAHFRQRLTEEDLRDNPPDLETASGRIASGKPASYRQLPFLPLEDEDIDQTEDQDEIDSENNGTYGSPEHELRQEKREAQKEKNEKTREIADEVLMVMSGSRAGLGGDDDWDAARVNPDNYDPDDPFYNSQPPIYEKGSSTTRDIAAGISDLEMGIPGSAAKLAKRIEHWNIPKKPINDTSELIAAQAEKDIPGTHDQTYKDMEDVRIDAEKKVDAEKKSIKEQYKAHFRQRLYEGDVIDKVKSIAGEAYARARNVFGPPPGELLVLAVKDLMRRSVTDTITNDTSNLRYAARDIPGVAAVEKAVAENGYFPKGGFYDRNNDGKEDDVARREHQAKLAKMTPEERVSFERAAAVQRIPFKGKAPKLHVGHPGEIPNSDPLPSDTQRA